MKKSTLHILLFCLAMPFILIACESKEEKEATRLLEEGKDFMATGQYQEVIRLMDSLHHTFHNAVDARKSALELSKIAQREQDKRDSAFIAPLLEQATRVADSLYAEFKMVPIPDMPDETILRYKGYDPSITPRQPFLDSYIDYDGELVIVAGLSASHPWQSNAIRLKELKSQTFVATYTIPYDGGLNYRYQDLGHYYERLTFTLEESKRLAQFIATQPRDAKVEVQWCLESGKPGPKLLLNIQAKDAIRACYKYYDTAAQIVAMREQLNQIEARKARS